MKVRVYIVHSFIPSAPLSKQKLLGEQTFKLKEIMNQGAFCTKPLLNEKKQSINKMLQSKRTTVTLRVEEIEQTSSVIQITFGAKDFLYRGTIFYTVYRSRDLGEFVPIYTSEKQRNDRITGSKWD